MFGIPIITPGTEFMDKLGKYLLKIKDHLKNKNLKVYLSDSNVHLVKENIKYLIT